MRDRIIHRLFRLGLRFFIRLVRRKNFYKPGHYHSPVPSKKDLQRNPVLVHYDGIDLSIDRQWQTLHAIAIHYPSVPFNNQRSGTSNYYYENRYFSYSDAIALFGIISEFEPKQIIELGAGISTACMMDTISQLGLSTSLESFDINGKRLEDIILYPPENVNFSFTSMDIRDIPKELFEPLMSNDILFVDGSHVTKYNSDLNHILFNILPILKPGVIIHFHDIFKNFEYPQAWLDEGIFWNEQYLIRAFLQENSSYEILLFSDYMESNFTEWYQKHLPLSLHAHEKYSVGPKAGKYIPDLRGQSLWLRKVKS